MESGAPPGLRSRFRDEAAHAETATARVPVRAPAPDGPGGRTTLLPLPRALTPGSSPWSPASFARPCNALGIWSLNDARLYRRRPSLCASGRLDRSWPILSSLPELVDPVLLQKTRSCFL